MDRLLHNGEFYAAACAFLWAAAVIYFRKGGDLVPPVVLNLFKNTVGFVLLVLSMLLVGVPFFPAERTLPDYLVLLGSGACGIALADSLFFASLNRLGAGRSAIVDCLYSPLVILCAFVYLHEPVGWTLVVAVALIGSAIFIGTWEPATDAPPIARREWLLGIGYGVVAMVLMSAAIVAAKPVITRAEPWWATTVRMAGALPLLLLLGATRRHRPAVKFAFTPGAHWKILMPGALLGAYFALVLWILGFKYASAGVAGVLNQMSTIIVLLLATPFLNEPLTKRKVVAIGMGFAGATLVVI